MSCIRARVRRVRKIRNDVLARSYEPVNAIIEKKTRLSRAIAYARRQGPRTRVRQCQQLLAEILMTGTEKKL